VQHRIPPPILALLAALLMFALHRLEPLATLFTSPLHLVGFGFIACAVAIDVIAFLEFRRVRTTVNPLKPESASTLVTSGLFSYSRNPMYVGMVLLLAGFAIYLGTLTPWIGPPLFVLVVTRLQIAPEERALERLFGAEYSAYRSRTARWFGRVPRRRT